LFSTFFHFPSFFSPSSFQFLHFSSRFFTFLRLSSPFFVLLRLSYFFALLKLIFPCLFFFTKPSCFFLFSLTFHLPVSYYQLWLPKVAMFSPAAKAGLQPGNTILVINDWKIEGMDQPQVSPCTPTY
jgi:hypothetical protein